MSTTKRIISGTAASWARIGVTLLTQIILVPFFLNYWDLQTYGIYIAIQAIVNVFGMIDRGYVDYLGYDFLKLGVENKIPISNSLWSGFTVIIITGVIELILISFLAFSNWFGYLLGGNKNIESSLIFQASWVLIIQWFGWAFFANTTGLFYRALTVYGYYARMAWWDVLIAFLTSLITILVVINGGNLLLVGISTNLFIIVITIPRIIDIKYLLELTNIKQNSFSIRNGFQKYLISLALSIRYILESFRQQGIRVILSPLIGVTNLATFTTIRTGANVMQQGLLTITNPLLPEMMRFINQKDNEKIEASFSTVWLILIFVLSPSMVMLQILMPSLFSIWTNGKMNFSPDLFSLLSVGILIYALAQPAMSLVVGNNLLKQQNIIAVLSSAILLISIIITVPKLSIVGVGISLLLAEILSALLFIFFLKKWLKKSDIKWPRKAFNLSVISIVASSIGMIIIISAPAIKWVICAIVILISIYLTILSIKNLPNIARNKVITLFKYFKISNNVF